jgi:hypothetical protein
MGHPHRPRTRGTPPRRYCRAAVRPDTPPAPHPHRPMPSLPLHLAPPVAPPTLAVRGLEANPPRAARPIRRQRPPPATTVRSSPGSVPNALSGPLPVRHTLGRWREDSKRMRSTAGLRGGRVLTRDERAADHYLSLARRYPRRGAPSPLDVPNPPTSDVKQISTT